MTWKVHFYPGVEDDILKMPNKIQARMLKLLELIERHGAIYILYAFVKKSQKTPKKVLELAQQRQREVRKS